MLQTTHHPNDLAQDISAILLQCDPLNIAYSDDEYDPEAREIVAGLNRTGSLQDVHNLVFEVFTDFFDPSPMAHEKERYTTAAEKIWERWQSFISTDR